VPSEPGAWVFGSENPDKPIWRNNLWNRWHLKPRLETIRLGWAIFQVLRRTHANLGHEAGIYPKVPQTRAGTVSASLLTFILSLLLPSGRMQQNSSKTLC
jgi:hypothetical protein